jgi:hypothetical protein
MATPVKVRRHSDEEGRQLQRIVRRGGGKTQKSIVKWRRALVLASTGDHNVTAIARLVQTCPDRVREMFHSFNDKWMHGLDLQWAGGRPRRITTEQRTLIISTARKRVRSCDQNEEQVSPNSSG